MSTQELLQFPGRKRLVRAAVYFGFDDAGQIKRIEGDANSIPVPDGQNH